MDLPSAVLLVAAGIATGGVNAIAGGGSLLSFPTLVAVGLPPIVANVTNSISVCPGYFGAMAGSRADLSGQRRRMLELLPTAAVGTVLGCVLLLVTPARAFELVVPFLVLGAAGTLAFQDRLRRLVGHPRHMSRLRQTLTVQAIVGLGSVYGGYFGAALGVMLVAGLALTLDETLARVNAAKNVISAVVGFVTVVVFALFGPVRWTAVALMAPATVVGGYLGAHLARRLPATVLRSMIVVFGLVVGLLLLVRAARQL